VKVIATQAAIEKVSREIARCPLGSGGDRASRECCSPPRQIACLGLFSETRNLQNCATTGSQLVRSTKQLVEMLALGAAPETYILGQTRDEFAASEDTNLRKDCIVRMELDDLT
jgi:hypothetical protein